MATYRTAAEWERIVEAYEKSGQTMAVFSKAHGINVKTLGNHLGRSPVPKVKRSPEEWDSLLEQQEASGMSVYAWCKSQGVSERGLRNVARKRTAKTKPVAVSGWVELATEALPEEHAKEQEASQIQEKPIKAREEAPAPQKEEENGKIRINSGGVEIEADAGYPIEKLAVLLGKLVKVC